MSSILGSMESFAKTERVTDSVEFRSKYLKNISFWYQEANLNWVGNHMLLTYKTLSHRCKGRVCPLDPISSFPLTCLSEYLSVSLSFWQRCCHSSSSFLCIGNLPPDLVLCQGLTSEVSKTARTFHVCFHSQKMSTVNLMHGHHLCAFIHSNHTY